MLLLALIIAALLRFWQLDQFPAGLYRDEAFNGLDALNVLDGRHALFFPANNGREPLYIYLTALAVALFGRTIVAVRFAAALVGTLTVIPFFLLAKSWFDWRTGILAAWLWAITLWPIHLSRIGLRTVLIIPILLLTFWLATEAYRRRNSWLWVLAGLVYGLGFYTYLAFRFTPLLLLLVVLYLLITGRARRLWPGLLWFSIAALIVLLPQAYLIAQQPDLLLGRSGQVSILNPDVTEGSPLVALGRSIWAAIGMFFWRGDQILRHNPPGRPVFDLLMIIPFFIGLGWCARSWRRPPAVFLLLWLLVMLGPTILAADAPHFLRAAGALPAAIILAAVGLASIWQWPRLQPYAGGLLVTILIVGSLVWTVVDYRAYSRDPQVAQAFDSAATELAFGLQSESPQTAVYLDDRLWTSWPSLSFLVDDAVPVKRFLSVDDLPGAVPQPSAIYAWPYDSLDFIPGLLQPPALVTVQDGALARGDFDQEAYPLYVRYGIESPPAMTSEPEATFDGRVYLHQANVSQVDPNTLQVDIYWEADSPIENDLIVFVHVSDADGLVAQDDAPLAGGRWPGSWWQPGVQLLDAHRITLSEPYDGRRHTIEIGLYPAGSGGERLPVLDDTGQELGTTWKVPGG